MPSASQRKRLLLTFAAIGSLSSILFLPLPSDTPVWPLSGLLAIIANICFGTSIVANNAYLPTLARESFEVVEARDKMMEAEMIDDSIVEVVTTLAENELPENEDSIHAPLLAGQHPSPHAIEATPRQEYERALSLATARLSSLGIASGYTAGILLLTLTLIPVTLMKGSTFSLRVAIGASGIWWALFSIPAGIWLPGPRPHERSSKISLRKEVKAAWARLGQMLRWKEIRALRYTFTYLAAWFLLSDGYTTITSTSILFAKTTLHMPPSSLILIGVIAPTFGIIGSLIVPRIQRLFHVTNLTVLVTLVVSVSFIPIYGCLGFLPFFKEGKAKFGGLTTPAEMYVLAAYFGSLYGAFQGYARAFFAELIPVGEEARWFALFSITDKV
jgi:UMF1 family MFS transporter